MSDFAAKDNVRSVNDDLAAMLKESAELVKQGKHDDPILSQTLEAFLQYMERRPGAAATPGRGNKTTTTSATNSSSNHNNNSSSIRNNNRSSTVNKPAATMSSILGKVLGNADSNSADQKAATSRKNADRAKADLAQELNSNLENNDKSSSSGFYLFPPIPGFTDDATLNKGRPEEPATATSTTTPKQASASTGGGDSSAASIEKPSSTTASSNRPEFRKSNNPESALVANGWIEQQRRSRLRTVWKEVLASLVEARKKGEETTLWIQRQIVNSQTNQKELEALHQIPVKWLEEINYYDYSADNRFSLKVFNLQEEFVFRCPKDSDAARKWVATLQAAKDKRLKKSKPENKTDVNGTTSPSSTEMKAPPSNGDSATPTNGNHNNSHQQYPFDEEEKKSSDQPSAAPAATPKIHRSVKELRAIAHGAGVQTVGMERGELEAVVDRILMSDPTNASNEFKQKQQEELDRIRVEKERMDHDRRMKEEQERRAKEAQERRMKEEQQRRVEAEQRRQQEEAARLKREEMERFRREAEKAEAARRAAEEQEHRNRIAERVRAQQEAEQRRREEEERIRQEHERIRLENERREREEAEHRRRIAEMQERERQEQMRKQQEEYARQQKMWHEQQAEAARLQKLQQEQEARKREEEMRRRRHAEQWAQANGHAQHHQWHGQQQQHHPHAPPPHGYAQQQQQHFPHPGQQPQQQHFPNHGNFFGAQPQPPPQQQQQPRGPPPPQQDTPQSTINQKYARMASTDSEDATSHRHIKHELLVKWALQPPMFQALKPIEALITSVHTVFPPSFGVNGHEYFKKWKAVQFGDISTGPPQNRIDSDKLNKTVRKLRFFLHPDKLPNDLSENQSFLIKLLWDITNDAFEEFKKKEEDLGWIRS